MYNYDHGLDAALAMNEGSEAPDYYSGPLWAVFDQDAVERNGVGATLPLSCPTTATSSRPIPSRSLAEKIRQGP